MARLGAWLSGPGAGLPGDDPGPDDHPGRRLGRPAAGRGAFAPFGRRLLGVSVDWVICLVIASAFLGEGALWPLAVFLAENVLLVGTLGATVGHRVAGLGIERVDGGRPGPLRAMARSVALCLVVPALIWDRDTRGMHDRLAGTVAVRW